MWLDEAKFFFFGLSFFLQKPLNLYSDAQEYENELQSFEDAIYEMERELDVAQQEREDLEKINEELNRMVFEMQESDRKKQQIIHKYQEQNKAAVLSQTLPISHNTSTSSSSGATIEIQKLNRSIALQPKSYRQYSHSSNPNNPFEDDDTDGSDWDESDSEDGSAAGNSTDDPNRFELIGTNRRQFKQSLAQIEKQLHLENGLEALALDDDEIEKLKSTHYNKQETLDKLKSIEKALDEKDRLEVVKDEKKRKKSSDIGGLPATIMEEGAEEEDSSDWDADNENPDDDNNDKLDMMIDPDILADLKSQQQQQHPPDIDTMPNVKPKLDNNDTIDDILHGVDLGGVGMEESEARQILQELMNLKSAINTPTLTSTGFTPLPSSSKMKDNINLSSTETPISPAIASSAGSIPKHLSLNNNSPSLNSMNALQQFQHTFQSSTNMLNAVENTAEFDEAEALKRAQEQVFQQETLKAQNKQSLGGLHGVDGNNGNNNFSDIFPTYSMASKSEFSLKDTTGSLLNIKQQGDMLDSMVSNQIELKLQQTQLEAAMTKMELLDELKLEIDVWNPSTNNKRRESKDDFGMPRISTLINLDELADELQIK